MTRVACALMLVAVGATASYAQGYGPPPPPPPGPPAEPGAVTEFFRFESEGFVSLGNTSVGGRVTLGYALGQVFSIHVGGRLLSDADYEIEVNAGMRFRIKTKGPLAFIIDPELVAGDGEEFGAALRVGTLYGLRPKMDLLLAGQGTIGSFDPIVSAGAGIIAYF